MQPPVQVLDLFVVPDVVVPLAGGPGGSVVAGDLVLSPGRDPDVLAWLNPVLARLAVRLDERPGRDSRDLRVAMPVPARDGSWVVDGWAASRYEPGTTPCADLHVALATAHLLHAELAGAVPTRPDDLAPSAESADLGPAQLVHARLAGNVLLDARGAPVVIDVEPAWRPARWAAALCVLDSVVAGTAPATALAAWTGGPDREALLSAASHRGIDVEALLSRLR